ncbi:hypothetical protein [Methylobacterium sp. JK268]
MIDHIDRHRADPTSLIRACCMIACIASDGATDADQVEDRQMSSSQAMVSRSIRLG